VGLGLPGLTFWWDYACLCLTCWQEQAVTPCTLLPSQSPGTAHEAEYQCSVAGCLQSLSILVVFWDFCWIKVWSTTALSQKYIW